MVGQAKAESVLLEGTRHRENAIQYATGRPMMARIAIVTADSRTLTPIAVQSTLHARQKESVSLQDGAALVTDQERTYGAR